MASVFEDINNLNTCSYFQSKSQMYEYLIMSIIGEKNEPIGSWALKFALKGYDANLSTATIGRYLMELDTKNITVMVSNKGRILTENGKKVLESIEQKVTLDILHNNIRQAAEFIKYGELIQLYTVRKALEVEAVKEAVAVAFDEDIDLLAGTIKSYRECILANKDFIEPALDFHLILASITKNSFLEAVLRMLIYEQKRIEAKFDILATREHGLEYVEEHEAIYLALKERDEAKAVKLMSSHLDATKTALEAQQ